MSDKVNQLILQIKIKLENGNDFIINADKIEIMINDLDKQIKRNKDCIQIRQYGIDKEITNKIIKECNGEETYILNASNEEHLVYICIKRNDFQSIKIEFHNNLEYYKDIITIYSDTTEYDIESFIYMVNMSYDSININDKEVYEYNGSKIKADKSSLLYGEQVDDKYALMIVKNTYKGHPIFSFLITQAIK